jgi:hypothetical protein
MHLVRNGWLKMMKRASIVIVLLLMIAGQVAAQSTKVLNFDAYKLGVMPDGFTSVTGEWKVVADGDAPSKPNALAQLAKNSGSTFNLILVNGTNQKDVDISVKLKAIAGGEDQGAAWFGVPKTKTTITSPDTIRWRTITGFTRWSMPDVANSKARPSDIAMVGIR